MIGMITIWRVVTGDNSLPRQTLHGLFRSFYEEGMGYGRLIVVYNQNQVLFGILNKWECEQGDLE